MFQGFDLGQAVFAKITDMKSFEQAFETVASAGFDDQVLIEQYIAGRDFRVVATRDQVLAVAERVPAHVVGDGRSSIQELVAAKNLIKKKNLYKKQVLIDPNREPHILAEKN